MLTASVLEPTVVWYGVPFAAYQLTAVPSPLMTASWDGTDDRVWAASLLWFLKLIAAWASAPESRVCAELPCVPWINTYTMRMKTTARAPYVMPRRGVRI